MSRKPSPHRWWTPERLATAHDLLEEGYSDREIADQFGTSVSCLERARRTYHQPSARPIRAAASAIGIARRLGVTVQRVYVWLERGWLNCRTLFDNGTVRRRFVTEGHLFSFLQNPAHWQRWEPAAVPDLALREWCEEIRAVQPLLSVTEAADRLGVTQETVRRYIRDGRLPAVGAVRWDQRVPASALEAFVPPCERPARTGRCRVWTPTETRRAFLWHRRGQNDETIAQRLGRERSSVRKRLQHPLLQTAYDRRRLAG